MKVSKIRNNIFRVWFGIGFLSSRTTHSYTKRNFPNALKYNCIGEILFRF